MPVTPNDDEIPHRFYLHRRIDESGQSGTGIVAVGTYFPPPNGRCVVAWLTDYNSVAVYDSPADVQTIHGHGGKTSLEWLDDPPEVW